MSLGPIVRRSFVTALVLLAVSCGAAPVGQPGTTSLPDNEGGFGAPSQKPGEFGDPATTAVTFEIRLDDKGCWYADFNGMERLVVFPEGFQQNPLNGEELVDSAGIIYGSGDRFDGFASMLPDSALPGGVDGKWGNYLSFCAPEVPEVAIVETLAEEFLPEELTLEESSAIVADAVFSEHWACGRGWAVSNADQTVGIVIYANGDEVVVPEGSIVLPSPDWSAQVLFGKQLFAQHCNDALEQWVAVPSIAGQWPFSSGSITVVGGMPDASELPKRVDAKLENASVDVGSGLVEFDEVDLSNTDFGFLAG